MSSNRKIYQMQITQLRDLTSEVRELVVECRDPQEFQFKAGQFVMLHVPQDPKPVLRAYSIASNDRNQKGFRLLFKYVPNGIASEFVWKLKGNETLQFTGPFGRVFFKEPPTDQIIFLNTGTGLSQHLCYLESKMDQFPSLKYRLLFGVRKEENIYFKDELNRLKEKLPDFQFEYVLSRASDSWQGKRGYVQNFISDFDYLNTPTTFYLCGNGAMIKDVKSLLETQGFDKTRIFAEAFD